MNQADFFRNNPSPRSPFQSDRVLLFILSFMSLFVELLLIRHMGSEIRIFSYFKNLALIAAFLGLGVGYMRAIKINMLVTIGALTALAVAAHPVTGFSNISAYLNLGDFNMWEAQSVDINIGRIGAGLALLVLLFFLILVSMIPFGQALAEIFDRSKTRIFDYSINITGSLMGIWFFAWISFERTPPEVWYLFALIGLFALYRWDIKATVLFVVAGLFSTAALVMANPAKLVDLAWSPYQKIRVAKNVFAYADSKGEKQAIEYLFLETNQTFYLNLLDLSEANRERHRTVFPAPAQPYLYYDLPYSLVKAPGDVLVLGAGGGNDVAAALRHGASKVTAVEIDPVIIEMGTKYHPERPYQSPKVTVINDDARNFLRNTDQSFDLIVLGLLDSHTLTSNFSNTNLDSFMYTLESVQDMKKRLKPGGVLALSFEVSFPWIGAKIMRMITNVFGERPVILPRFHNHDIWGTGGTYFLVGDIPGDVVKRVEKEPFLNRLAIQNKGMIPLFEETKGDPQTDDWPYLYVPTHSIPSLHLFVSVILLLIFSAIYGAKFGKPTGSDLHFTALGAGFLLLEVSVISRFALFWGTTWVVSSIVISIILVTILVANAVVIKTKGSIPYPALYAAVGVSMLIVYLAPLDSAWVIAIYLIPFSAIGYLFAKSFDQAPHAGRALGYNLFGALAGGLSESLSFLWGISSLILVALSFYALSFLFLRLKKG